MNAIIEDLLSLSRIERGAEELTIPLEYAGVADVLRSAAEMCEKKAADKNVTLAVRCDEDLTGFINAPLLEQAVVNLVDNAVKYSPSGTSVPHRSRAGRAWDRDLREGRGLWHCRRALAATVRTVLPCRQGP